MLFLILKVGFKVGLCNVIIMFFFNLWNVLVKLIVIVDLFLFVGVGFIVVIKIIFFLLFFGVILLMLILVL